MPTVSSKHPDFSNQHPDWELLRTAYKGQRAVKAKTTQYLPYTSGQLVDGVTGTQPGAKAYTAYILRARYPNFVREAVQTAIGMMHTEPPKISLPKELENIVTTKGEGPAELLRKINEQQLITGRIGLLLDLPSEATTGKDIPYMAIYEAERIVNWDDGKVENLVPQSLNLVVLDESETERVEQFSWKEKQKYRVLVLGSIDKNEESGVYSFGVFDGDENSFSEDKLQQASFRGKTLSQIPFVFINSCDLVPEPDEPPLLDLGNLCLTIYRGEADYRQNLFMQGQDTLVTIGANLDPDAALRTGAGARIDVVVTGDAKYIGVDSAGLSEQRTSLENDRSAAGTMGAQTLDSTSRERESGSSMKIRVAARTADLRQIALTGAKGLEDLLKIAAEWIGANPDKVKIEPNLEFVETGLTGQSMLEMQTARNAGYPISAESLHEKAFDQGLTKKTFEEEMAQAEKEQSGPFKLAETADRDPKQVQD